MELNHRSLGILQELRKAQDYTKLEVFAEKYRVSIRAIRYDIEKISDFLEENGFPKLEKNHLRGVKLNKTETIENWLDTFVAKESDPTYFFSKEERKMIMAMKLLEAQEPIVLSYFQNFFGISKNTVLKEMDDLEHWMASRQLMMIRKPRIGIYIKGSELSRRNAMIELMSETIGIDEIFNYFSKKMVLSRTDHIKFDLIFSAVDIDYINQLIQSAEKNLEKRFTDEAYSNLLTHISLMLKRIQLDKNIKLPKIKMENVTDTAEYKEATQMVAALNQRYKVDIPVDEIKFITIHLLGAQVIEDQSIQEHSLSQAVDQMIDEIQMVYGLQFASKREELKRNLMAHLRPAIYRMSLGMMIKNPLHEKIMEEFGQLYAHIELAAKSLENYMGFEMDPHEITNLTLHFGAFIEEKNKSKREIPRVILVCASGIGTAVMLAMQLQQKYDCQVIEKLSARAIEKIEGLDYDYIISTVDIPNLGREDYLKINPLLLKQDEKLLKQYLRPKIQQPKTDIERVVKDLVEITKKYAQVKDEQQLAYEFLFALKKNRKKITGKEELNITDVITKDTVKVKVHTESFEDALKQGVNLLVDQDYVHADYYQDIVESIAEMGPYMAIAPGIFLSHARPNAHVYATSMSILTLKEPKASGNADNDPIRLVITLAAEDNDNHLRILSQLTNILLEPEDLESIFNANTKEDILEIIKKQE